MHEVLSEQDMDRASRRNKKNGYALTNRQLLAYGRLHRKARMDDNWRMMAYIEYLLTDINFHHECSLLSRGEYDQFFGEI